MVKVQEPHNLEAEQALLGAILLEPHLISRAVKLVRPADFFIEAHSYIYRGMLDLAERGTPIDLVTLTEQLQSRGWLEEIGGLAVLTGLVNAAPTFLHFDYYAAIVRKYSRLRRLIAGAGKLARIAHAPNFNLDEILGLAEATLLALVQKERLQSVRPLSELVGAYLDRLSSQPEGKLGLSTGLKSLDALCGRLQPADLVLLTGEPGTLKTALALHIARQAGKSVLFSLESSAAQVVQRLLVSETGLPPELLRVGSPGVHWTLLQEAGSRLSELELYLDDTPGLLVTDLRSKARWLHYLWGLDLVIVNYLELLRYEQRQDAALRACGGREEELAAISRALKALARELNLPVLVVSRLESATHYEADVIWQCQKVDDSLYITQTRWRDGPAGAMVQLNFDPLRQTFDELGSQPGKEQPWNSLV